MNLLHEAFAALAFITFAAATIAICTVLS